MLKEKIKPKYLFDPFLKKPFFKNNLIFSYKKQDFLKFLNNSTFYSLYCKRRRKI